MTAARTLLRDLDALRNTRDLKGFFAGGASGLIVSLSVFLFCVGWGMQLDKVPWAVVPVGIALVCTTVTSALAIRAPSQGRAIIWVFSGNVLPPTLLCLPTVLGVIYATPAGLMAFAATLPIVILARSAHDGGAVGAQARERLVGAGALVLAAGSILAFILLAASTGALDGPPSQGAWHGSILAAFVPTTLAVAATVLAGTTALPELRRAHLADRIHRGLVPGLESEIQGDVTEVRQVVTVAGGPMRGGQSRETLGAMIVAPRRAALGLLLTGAAIVVCALCALVAVV